MNENDFTQIVNQYSKLIFTVSLRFVKDYQEAENLTQETFITAYRVIDNFIGDNYKPWLVKIATNKCKDYLKSAYVRKITPTDDEVMETYNDGSEIHKEVESDERMKIIKNACESLAPPYREVAVMHFIEDKSFDEVAKSLNRPVKTVQTQGYRARDKLRTILKEVLCGG